METPPSQLLDTQDLPSAHDPPVPAITYAIPATDVQTATELVTRGDAACIVVKLIGVYVIVQAIAFLPIFLARMIPFRGFDGPSLLIALVLPAVFGGVGIFLFVRAERVAKHLLPRSGSLHIPTQAHGATQLQAMAFSVVGLLLVVWAAPTLAWLSWRLFGGDMGSGTIQAPFSARLEALTPMLVSNGVQVALGVWLFVGSKALAAWWGRMRHPEFEAREATWPSDETPPID